MYITSQLKKRHYEIVKDSYNSAFHKHFSLQIIFIETISFNEGIKMLI